MHPTAYYKKKNLKQEKKHQNFFEEIQCLPSQFALNKLSLLPIKYHSSLKQHFDFFANVHRMFAHCHIGTPSNTDRMFIGTGFAQRWCQIKYQMSFQILILVVVGGGKTYILRAAARSHQNDPNIVRRPQKHHTTIQRAYILILWCQENHIIIFDDTKLHYVHNICQYTRYTSEYNSKEMLSHPNTDAHRRSLNGHTELLVLFRIG